jgi:hypothetical protein
MDLYVLYFHTEISNGTNELYHVKRLAVVQNKPFWIPYGRMNHLCHHWNKHMLNIVQNTFYSRRAQWLPFVDERFVIDESIAISIIFLDLVWQKMLPSPTASFQQETMVLCMRVLPLASSLLSKSMKHGSHGSSNHVKNANTGNQLNTAFKEAAIVSKMQTPAITLWFPKHRF